MHLITQRSATLVAIASLVAAATHMPLRTFLLLSRDKVVTDHTLLEARLIEGVLWLVACTTALAVAIWRSGKSKRLRQAIEGDYADFVAQGAPRLPTHRASVQVSFLVLLIVFLGILCTIRSSFQYHGRGYPCYDAITAESGLWESLTALGLLAAGATLIIGVVRLRSFFYRRWSLVTPAGMGAMFLLGAGEEVSWGQHWFGFTPPEALSALNTQNELNLHNIGGYWANDALVAFLFVYVVLLPVLAQCFPDVRYMVTRLSVPMVPVALVPYGLVALFLDERYVLCRLWGNPPWRLSEAREMIFSAVVCCASAHAVLTWRRHLHSDPDKADVGDSSSNTGHGVEL